MMRGHNIYFCREIRKNIFGLFSTPLLSGALILSAKSGFTVKILKIGTPEIITIIVLQLEQLDFTVQYCVQKMQRQTDKQRRP